MVAPRGLRRRPANDSGPGSLAWASVLVVDDDSGNRDLLARRILQLGASVRQAENGRTALALLNTWDVDLVLLDILMPELGGFEVLRVMRADARLRGVPVIVVSALHDMDQIVHGIQLGADDYLPKPCHPALLRARISAALERKQLRDRDLAQRYTMRAEAAALNAWNQHLERRVGESPGLAHGATAAHSPPGGAPGEARSDAEARADFPAAPAVDGTQRVLELVSATVDLSALLTEALPPASPLLVYVREIAQAGREAERLLARTPPAPTPGQSRPV